mgnify:FL=1
MIQIRKVGRGKVGQFCSFIGVFRAVTAIVSTLRIGVTACNGVDALLARVCGVLQFGVLRLENQISSKGRFWGFGVTGWRPNVYAGCRGVNHFCVTAGDIEWVKINAVQKK